MKAHDFLEADLQHMKDRAKTYDNPQGERSIGKTVSAFNAITGHNLTEEQGWMFMALLKIVRSQQGEYKSDNYEDLASYSGLMGEAAYSERVAVKHFPETSMDDISWNQSESEEESLQSIPWHLVPKKYSRVAKDMDGKVYFYTAKPEKGTQCWFCTGDYVNASILLGEKFTSLLANVPWEMSLTMRPSVKAVLSIPWDKIPEKYQWFARDSNGEAFFYRNEPKPSQYKRWSLIGNDYAYAGRFGIAKTEPVENWRNTLLQRPTTHPFSDPPGGQNVNKLNEKEPTKGEQYEKIDY